VEPMPGALIGQGRHADVFALDDSRVLHRYRTRQPAEPEAAIMRYVHGHGYPVPRVIDVAGPDIVMERVTGPSMLSLMARRPHRLGALARLLRDLHVRLHAIPAPEEWQRPVGAGDSVLHLDLQPANVVMTATGPVVLDWGFAAAGPPQADVAHTWLQLATSEVPGAWALRAAGTVGRRFLIRSFLRGFDETELLLSMNRVIEYRLAHRELTKKERDAIRSFKPSN